MRERSTAERETEHAIRNELWGLRMISARDVQDGRAVSGFVQARIEELERTLADLRARRST